MMRDLHVFIDEITKLDEAKGRGQRRLDAIEALLKII